MVKGLSYVPNFTDNSQEYVPELFDDIAVKIAPKDYFSARNSYLLFACIDLLKLNTERSGTILEIGIGKKERYKFTSTATILNTKHSAVRYVGIDAENREWLLGRKDNIFLYHNLSANVFEKINKKKYIDLLHIDGSHSVNGVLIDWQFSQLVKDDGIILLHDIKAHPGPKLLVDAIDKNIYTVDKWFLDDPKDFGMAVVYKKENDYGKILKGFA
jgi:hypothetical protein